MTKDKREPCCVNTALPEHPQVTMAYVPFQLWGELYDPEKALHYGTLFPELNKPFTEGRRGGSR